MFRHWRQMNYGEISFRNDKQQSREIFDAYGKYFINNIIPVSENYAY